LSPDEDQCTEAGTQKGFSTFPALSSSQTAATAEVIISLEISVFSNRTKLSEDITLFKQL